MDHTDQIRQRAYELWQAHGCPDGKAEEYWFAAEREMLTETSLRKPKSQSKPRSARLKRSVDVHV